MNEVLPSVEEEASARYKFLLWFANPYKVLSERGNGHGEFIALSIGLQLCERYFRYQSGTSEIWSQDGFLLAAARHFQTDYGFFKEFWNVYAHGMRHQGTPQSDANYGWAVDDEYPQMPTRAFEEGKTIICLNPWKFTEEMIVLCWNDPMALTKISNQPLGCAATGPLKWEYVASM